MPSWFFTVKWLKITSVIHHSGRVVELVDTLALGASGATREGSSPFSPTIAKLGFADRTQTLT